MDAPFLTIPEAAKRAGKEKFFQNVKRAVIPRLIEKGMLTGKKEGRRQLVADDDALARIMRLGVESFIYNQKGYSFTAVRAPIDDAATRLKARPCVARYEPNIKPQAMQDHIELKQDKKLRQAFLAKIRNAPEWSVLFLTVHWFHSQDAVIATALAGALSQQLETVALAGWYDEFSAHSLIVCEDGELKQAISDADDEEEEEQIEDGWARFYEHFYEQGVYLPQTFIGGGPDDPAIYVADPAEVERADFVLLNLPGAVQSRMPHVFEKFGMMAEAMTEGLDDEQAFMDHLQSGVWNQAQALLAAGEF